MDYKEMYEKAIKRAKAMIQVAANQEEIYNSVITIFPEPRESEDEKIRKELIEQVVYIVPNDDEVDSEGNVLPIYQKRIDKYLAWLEKQGEKESDPRYKYLKELLRADDIYQMAMNDAMVQEAKTKAIDALSKLEIGNLLELEKQGEQKEYTFKSLPRLLDMIEPTSKAKAYCQKLIDALVKEGYTTDAKIVGECLKAMNGENVPMAIMDEKQGEQNLAWSEEDEENFARVDYACLKVYGGDSYSSDWLRKILGIHKKWKPSEEQMKVLDAAVMHSHLTTAEYDGLVKLREQLKKLREE